MSRSNSLVLASALALGASGGSAAAEAGRVVLLLSDMGLRDASVAVCKGVMLSVDPALRFVDLTHDVAPFDVEGAADVLERTVPFYPAGTVVSAWVDPGTGSPRRGIAVRTKAGHILVGPDNGVFTGVMRVEGIEAAVELAEERFFRRPISPTFSARDVFAPAAARLAGGLPIEELGPAAVPLSLSLRPAELKDGAVFGEVRSVEDPFGNLITNIPARMIAEAGLAPGTPLEVVIGERKLALLFVRTFSDVPRGESMAVLHDRGVLAFAVNQGDFAAVHEVGRRDAVSVRRK